MVRIATLLIAVLLALPASATEAGWALLREGGHVVMLRHAYAQGTTEPSDFDIADCRKQRGLSDRGRQQARKIGSLFSARAAPADAVLTSRLCRAQETARLAFRDGDVEPVETLDPVPSDTAAAAEQAAAILALVEGHTGSGNLVLVTDLTVIQAVTGAGAREGEAVIVRRDGDRLHVLARIVF